MHANEAVYPVPGAFCVAVFSRGTVFGLDTREEGMKVSRTDKYREMPFRPLFRQEYYYLRRDGEYRHPLAVFHGLYYAVFGTAIGLGFSFRTLIDEVSDRAPWISTSVVS